MVVGSHMASAISEVIFVSSVFGDGVTISEYDFVAYLGGLLPVFIIIHLLRKVIRDRHHMIASLQTFAVSDAQCRSDFDREFIQNAICAWYGSEKAFEDFVRHSLREELMGIACTSRIPLHYIPLVAAPVVASTFDCITSMVIGQAPTEVVLTHFLGFSLAQSFFWFFPSLSLIIYLCDRWAFPVREGWDHATTFLIFLAFYAIFVGGQTITNLACSHSFWTTLVWFIFTIFVTACLVLKRSFAGKSQAIEKVEVSHWKFGVSRRGGSVASLDPSPKLSRHHANVWWRVTNWQLFPCKRGTSLNQLLWMYVYSNRAKVQKAQAACLRTRMMPHIWIHTQWMPHMMPHMHSDHHTSIPKTKSDDMASYDIHMIYWGWAPYSLAAAHWLWGSVPWGGGSGFVRGCP